jgi:hypothetical protein
MDAPAFYLTPPADIANQAIDMLGQSGKIIGDLGDGTVVAETARRNYGRALRQLLRTAHWNFARKQCPLTLLGDATGNSSAPVSTFVEQGWIYAYAWPTDGVAGRWMPFNPGSAIPVNNHGVPLTTGTTTLPWYPLTPGRFLVSSSDQYPIEIGSPGWTQAPDLQRTEGLGPTSRRVILTNCSPCAQFVYTRLVTVIEEWDDLFREAMVTMMALILAPVAIEDPKMAMVAATRLGPALKNAVDNARVANGNEAGYPQTIDKTASYIAARNQGAWGGYGWGGGGLFFGGGLGGGGDGYLGMGWSDMSWGGSVF